MVQPGAPTSRRLWRRPHAVTSPLRGWRLGGPRGPAPSRPARRAPASARLARPSQPGTTFSSRLHAARPPPPRQQGLHFPELLAVRRRISEVPVGCNFWRVNPTLDSISQEAARRGAASESPKACARGAVTLWRVPGSGIRLGVYRSLAGERPLDSPLRP